MSTTNTGGPAFPQDIGWCSPNQHIQYRGPQGGMTLRDYFAAKAMQGILANGATNHANSKGQNLGENLQLVAPVAYEIADAMLKARDA